MEKVDFLVIGAGVSGLSTAIKLQKYGKVLVILKRDFGDCNTYYAAGGIACSGPWSEDYEGHIKDTLVAGAGLCKKDVVEYVVYHGTERIQELMDWGLDFDIRDSGKLDLGKEGGHHTRRVLHTGDLTGRSVHKTLLEKARSLPNIEFRPYQMAVNLIKKQGECAGCYILDVKTEKIYTIKSKATIIAAGGIGKVFLYTSNPDVSSGDGIAMAWRAGAKISNMEFVQFHPTVLYHPEAKNTLVSEALRGEGAILKDKRGNRFMEGVHPLNDLAPRDIVSRTIDRVLKESGDECVYLDISFKNSEFVKERFPGIYNKCIKFGIDITKEPIPVVPAAHYSCGGVTATIKGKTNIPRLFVVGESSCTGLHGANRLASNSLLEGLVCGHECGEYIGKTIGSQKFQKYGVKEWEADWVVDSNEAFVINLNWNEIRMFMQNYCSIIRSDSYLKRARRRISILRDEIHRYYWNFKITSDLLELRNLLDIADLIVRSALARRESRGTHYTLDYPEKADVIRDTIIKKPWL